MYKRAFGEELFDREANAYHEEGTKENPIPILSTEEERIVGISLPDDAEVRWMILRKNELLYDPDTCNYFALKQVRGGLYLFSLFLKLETLRPLGNTFYSPNTHTTTIILILLLSVGHPSRGGRVDPEG